MAISVEGGSDESFTSMRLGFIAFIGFNSFASEFGRIWLCGWGSPNRRHVIDWPWLAGCLPDGTRTRIRFGDLKIVRWADKYFGHPLPNSLTTVTRTFCPGRYVLYE